MEALLSTTGGWGLKINTFHWSSVILNMARVQYMMNGLVFTGEDKVYAEVRIDRLPTSKYLIFFESGIAERRSRDKFEVYVARWSITPCS